MGSQGPGAFDECIYLQALGVLFFTAGPTAMPERARASRARSCKVPRSLKIATNPGPVSGGESGWCRLSRKVTAARGGGRKNQRGRKYKPGGVKGRISRCLGIKMEGFCMLQSRRAAL